MNALFMHLFDFLITIYYLKKSITIDFGFYIYKDSDAIAVFVNKTMTLL